MENLNQQLKEALQAGSPVNISGFLREFEENSLNPDFQYTEETAVFHLFACYLTNNLTLAKLLYSRLPEDLKKPTNVELTQSWHLGTFLCKKDFSKVFELLNVTRWNHSQILAKMLADKLRSDIKVVISKGFSSIQEDKACSMLGVNKQNLAELCQQWGWQYAEPFVRPVPFESKEHAREVSQYDVQLVTQLMNFLENQPYVLN